MINISLKKFKLINAYGKKIFLLVFLLSSVILAVSAKPDSDDSQQLKIKGLNQPVNIIRDHWGVMHIYAKNTEDLFFAQGYVAAMDRLWQLEVWRRSTMGELAEVFGVKALEHDKLARLMKYRGSMELEWKSYAPDAKKIIESFVRGINAYIETTGSNLPPEFKILGIKPKMWTPEICLNRLSGLEVSGNASREVLRARLVKAIGEEKTSELLSTDPYEKTQIPEGLDLNDINDSIANLLAARTGIAPPAATAGISIPATPFETSPPDPSVFVNGSNNWVVSGKVSATGKPILAGDPHRGLEVPSLRYMIHLSAPGWNVIGAGEPALPGVAIGHNEYIGFAFTIHGMDQQDIYVEEINPQNASEYNYKGSWKQIKSEMETINVKGSEKPFQFEAKFTQHGPVIYEDKSRQRMYVLRSVFSEPGTAPYLAALSVDRANNWTSFIAALNRWKSPSQNFVYADVKGNIGLQVAGLMPVRENWSGLLPVPGKTGKYEWNGFLDFNKLPRFFNPSSGFLVSANNNVLPPGYKYQIGYEFATPFRANRIKQVLEKGKKWTMNDFQNLQRDQFSLIALQLVPLLKDINFEDERSRQAASILLNWNYDLDKDSTAAVIYELWRKHLPVNTFKPFIPKSAWEIIGQRDLTIKMLDVLENPKEDYFGENPEKKRNDVLIISLREAVEELQQKLGMDMNLWKWGKLHTVELAHPFASVPEGNLFKFPAFPRGGDNNTVNATSSSDLNFKQVHGASYRQVLDLSNWNNSKIINTPGQSGNPASKFYGNLLPLWAENQYFPMLFTKKQIINNSDQNLILNP